MPTPIFSKTFIQASIASGALVPPPGGYPTAFDRVLRLTGWILALAGVVLLGVAIYFTRA